MSDVLKSEKEIAQVYLNNAIKDIERGDVAIGLDQAKAALHWLGLIREAPNEVHAKPQDA